MSEDSPSPENGRFVGGFFDHQRDAEEAVADLESRGFKDHQLIAGEPGSESSGEGIVPAVGTPTSATGSPYTGGMFRTSASSGIAELGAALDVSQEEAKDLLARMRPGNAVMVLVQVKPGHETQAGLILERNGAHARGGEDGRES